MSWIKRKVRAWLGVDEDERNRIRDSTDQRYRLGKLNGLFVRLGTQVQNIATHRAHEENTLKLLWENVETIRALPHAGGTLGLAADTHKARRLDLDRQRYDASAAKAAGFDDVEQWRAWKHERAARVAQEVANVRAEHDRILGRGPDGKAT